MPERIRMKTHLLRPLFKRPLRTRDILFSTRRHPIRPHAQFPIRVRHPFGGEGRTRVRCLCREGARDQEAGIYKQSPRGVSHETVTDRKERHGWSS